MLSVWMRDSICLEINTEMWENKVSRLNPLKQGLAFPLSMKVIALEWFLPRFDQIELPKRRQRRQNGLYLHCLPATSSSSAAVSPACHAQPSPLPPALFSVSPPPPSASGFPSALAVGEGRGRERKKKRIPDRSLIGVNYSSLKPVKGRDIFIIQH